MAALHMGEKLLQLSRFSGSPPFSVLDEITRRAKKQERSGGVRVRWRRCPGVAVPAVGCGNVRSVRNKIEELHELTRWDCVYRESSLICLTKTWFQQDKDRGSDFALNCFTLIPVERIMQSGKSCGGGVCTYVNSR